MKRLIVFAKAPRSGLVKTRLARAIGPERACACYRQMLAAVGRALAGVRPAVLCVEPAGSGTEFAPYFPGDWPIRPQSGGDLGERMAGALAEARAEGCDRAAIVGTDCPYLTAADIAAAWEALDGHDVVLGPAEDGGYWLIGARLDTPAGPRRELFGHMPWGTGAVLGETLVRCRRWHWSAALLRRLPDIDTLEDWERFQNTLSAAPIAPHSASNTVPR